MKTCVEFFCVCENFAQFATDLAVHYIESGFDVKQSKYVSRLTKSLIFPQQKIFDGNWLRWSPRGHILKSLALPQRSSPWPGTLKSSKIALSSARKQLYFLNSRNFLGKRQKPRGKFANTFFVFHIWSIGVARGGQGSPAFPPAIEIYSKTPFVSSVLVSF